MGTHLPADTSPVQCSLQSLIHAVAIALSYKNLSYKVCHGFRFTKRDDYFQVNFDHF